jgi:methylphosphotriester-DNA--protein-cysteine methyltransferase
MEIFRKATGIPFLKLVEPDEKKLCIGFGKGGNEFCSLLNDTSRGREICLEAKMNLLKDTAKKRHTHQCDCFAGMSEFAIPIMDGGRHVATLISGQVFLQKPTKRNFQRMAKRITGGLDKGWEKDAENAYFQTPVLQKEQFEAIIQLLTVFSQHLAAGARRHLMAAAPQEHQAVTSAKKFIQFHSGESISLEQVLKHVHVSRFHFCKIFKKATGMTLTEYIAHVRVGKAKSLLLDPTLRITDVVFAAGFGSIAQFNNIFKRIVGSAPRDYRAEQRSQMLV